MLVEMCVFVEPACDGDIVYQDFVLARGFERNGLAIAVESQDADAIVMKLPAVDPAVLLKNFHFVFAIFR